MRFCRDERHIAERRVKRIGLVCLASLWVSLYLRRLFLHWRRKSRIQRTTARFFHTIHCILYQSAAMFYERAIDRNVIRTNIIRETRDISLSWKTLSRTYLVSPINTEYYINGAEAKSSRTLPFGFLVHGMTLAIALSRRSFAIYSTWGASSGGCYTAIIETLLTHFPQCPHFVCINLLLLAAPDDISIS